MGEFHLQHVNLHNVGWQEVVSTRDLGGLNCCFSTPSSLEERLPKPQGTPLSKDGL